MLVDKPLTAKEILEDKDERERIKLLLSTINTLAESNQHGSISVSINGDWGSGKTTYLKVIESYFRDFCGFPVVFYEAWKYQDDKNPLSSLILEIREIPNIKAKIKGRLSNILKPILASGITISDIFLSSIAGKGIESIEKAFSLIEKEQLGIVSKYRNNLKLLSDTIKEIKDIYRADKEGLPYKNVWSEYAEELPALKEKNSLS